MVKLTKEKIFSIIKVILGNVIYTASVAYFVLPYNIMSGGTAGISLICRELFGINPTIMIDIFTWAMFVIGWIFLGKKFALKTLISAIVYPLLITVLAQYPYAIDANPLLIAIFGGVIAGVGLGMVLNEDASTGGTDIPAIIVAKYTKISLPVLMFITDGLITGLGIISYGAESVMIGIIYIYCYNVVINQMIVPKTDSAVSLFIISEHKDEICQYIHQTLERGTTILYGKGGYTNEGKEVIMTVVSKNQYGRLEKEIEKIDKYAFIIVSNAKEIKGEGFTYEYRV